MSGSVTSTFDYWGRRSRRQLETRANCYLVNPNFFAVEIHKTYVNLFRNNQRVGTINPATAYRPYPGYCPRGTRAGPGVALGCPVL